MKNQTKIPLNPKLDHNETRNDTDNSKASHSEKPIDSQLSIDDPSLLFDYCLVDHSGKQFACTHSHCLKQSTCFKNSLLQEKLDFHELGYHPEDRRLWCEAAYPDILRFIDSEPVVEFPDYRFIFNHRYVRKDGSISQFMHEGSLTFADDKRVPLLNLNVFFEIADIKVDETMILTIFRYSADQGYQKVFTRSYSIKRSSNLTHREKEILILCQEGLSSKMIADKLNLSIHTVKNHKRNCMEKTGTHNISELIHFCIQNHWL